MRTAASHPAGGENSIVVFVAAFAVKTMRPSSSIVNSGGGGAALFHLGLGGFCATAAGFVFAPFFAGFVAADCVALHRHERLPACRRGFHEYECLFAPRRKFRLLLHI
jgi:hypothetical protein